MPKHGKIRVCLDNTFMGAIAENYVAQALAAKRIPLYYWRNSNTAELDFLWAQDTRIIPIEVKKGLHTRAKSMNQFRLTYNPEVPIRISQKNLGLEEGIRSIPFYAVFFSTNFGLYNGSLSSVYVLPPVSDS